MQWLSFLTAKSNAEIKLHCMLMTTLSSITAARWLQEPEFKERAREVLPMVVLTGLDTWDLLLAPLPWLSGHACVYSYLSALNVSEKSKLFLKSVRCSPMYHCHTKWRSPLMSKARKRSGQMCDTAE